MSEKVFNKCENPWDVFHAFRKGKDGKVKNSIHIKHPMYRADACPEKGNGDQPLQIFSDFSRLVVTIISNGEYVTANIAQDRIPGIIDKLIYAKEKVYDKKMGFKVVAPAEDQKSEGEKAEGSPAYMVYFRDGELIGKTPAEAVIDGNEALLNSEYVRLKNDPDSKDIIEAIKDAAEKLKSGELKPLDNPSSKAYTVQISNGKLRGKTPAEALKEENGEKLLLNQKKWLEENLDKYPKNKEQIEAIEDALNLLKNGQIKDAAPVISQQGSNTTTAGYMEILGYEPKPLWRNVDKDNLCPVNEIQIVCDLSQNSEFIFNIKSYKSEVFAVGKDGKKVKVTYDQVKNGGFVNGETFRVNKDSMKDSKFKSMHLSDDEISDLIRKIKNSEAAFIVAHGEQQLYEAVKSDEYNRTKRD